MAVLVVLVGVHVERHILPVVVLILIFVLVFILAKVWRERVSQGWRGGKERDWARERERRRVKDRVLSHVPLSYEEEDTSMSYEREI
jgi:hypothetical protein